MPSTALLAPSSAALSPTIWWLPVPKWKMAAFLACFSARRPLSQPTISPVEAPGVKIFSIPASRSRGMSSLGMIPPPNTSTSPAPFSRSSVTTFGNSVMCAPEWQDRPTASASSWIVVSAICSGVWCRPV